MKYNWTQNWISIPELFSKTVLIWSIELCR